MKNNDSMTGTLLMAIAITKDFDTEAVKEVLKYWQEDGCLSAENFDRCISILEFMSKAKNR